MEADIFASLVLIRNRRLVVSSEFLLLLPLLRQIRGSWSIPVLWFRCFSGPRKLRWRTCLTTLCKIQFFHTMVIAHIYTILKLQIQFVPWLGTARRRCPQRCHLHLAAPSRRPCLRLWPRQESVLLVGGSVTRQSSSRSVAHSQWLQPRQLHLPAKDMSIVGDLDNGDDELMVACNVTGPEHEPE